MTVRLPKSFTNVLPAVLAASRAPASKYKNRKVLLNGHLFDSQREAEVYRELMILMVRGDLARVHCQVPFPLLVNGQKVCTYRADFETVTPEGEVEIIDVKGYRTAVYNLKRRLFRAVMGFDIIERA